MKVIFLVLGCFLFTNIHPLKHLASPYGKANYLLLTHQKQDGDHNCTHTIINDKFSNNIIDVRRASKEGINFLFKKSFKINAIANKKNYNPMINGNLYVVTSGLSKIVLSNISDTDRKKKANVSWFSADIKDGSILVHNSISVGMNKAQFFRTLNSPYSTCDSISINNEERNYENIFIFNKNILRRIILGSII